MILLLSNILNLQIYALTGALGLCTASSKNRSLVIMFTFNCTSIVVVFILTRQLFLPGGGGGGGGGGGMSHWGLYIIRVNKNA